MALQNGLSGQNRHKIQRKMGLRLTGLDDHAVRCTEMYLGGNVERFFHDVLADFAPVCSTTDHVIQ